MKIAILSPVVWRTPPRQYGPWEQVASNLAEGLAARGVDVTLFATADSRTSGRLAACIEKPTAEDPGSDAKVNECLHISYLMERATEFDLIHNHYDFLPLTYSRLITTPMVTTIHGFSSPLIVPVYKKYNDRCHYVSISESDRNPELRYAATVYNGIDPAAFTLSSNAADYLLFFGRIHPEKGVLEAIQVARSCGKKIVISGLIQDARYFEEKIKPLIDDRTVIYVGNSDPERRDRLLGSALALLHLINFDEPFGLSVAEAMFCGTPVIAFNRGSMPELIEHGKTGFLVRTEEEAAEAVNNIQTIDRHYCRQWASSKFSLEKMTSDYLAVYEQVLQPGTKPVKKTAARSVHSR